jgi:hypothetical protein
MAHRRGRAGIGGLKKKGEVSKFTKKAKEIQITSLNSASKFFQLTTTLKYPFDTKVVFGALDHIGSRLISETI